DKRKAFNIAREALRYLEITCVSQDKRMYYNPVGRKSREPDSSQTDESNTRRNKIFLIEEQLFQLLIYNRASIYEDALTADQESLVTFYLMNIVKQILKRSSFYAAILNYHFLYGYSREQTMNIYLIIDPVRYESKLPHHFDRAKEILAKQWEEKFSRLKIEMGLPRSPHSIEWFRKCLLRFNIWGKLGQSIACVLPKDFDATNLTVEAFYADTKYENYDPVAEQVMECKRIHTLLDPVCHTRLIAALGYEPPEQRVRLPQFETLGNGNKMTRVNREHPPDLDDKEINKELDIIALEEQRRKTVSLRALSVIVDLVPRAHLDLHKEKSSTFTISESAELIEVWADNKPEAFPLAAHLLAYDETGSAQSFTITIASGQQIHFDINPIKQDCLDIAEQQFQVKVSYQETKFSRAIIFWWQRLRFYLMETLLQKDLLQLVTRFALLVIVIGCVVAALWLVNKNQDLQTDLKKLEKEQAALLEREQQLKTKLENQRTQIESMQKELNMRSESNTIEEIVQLTLSPIDIIRGDNEVSNTKVLSITADTKTIRLKLNLGALIGYKKYRVEIRRRDGELMPVWNKAELRASGKLVICNVPVAKLPPGRYLLQLTGSDDNDLNEYISYNFTIKLQSTEQK
ncbi:MAG: hypothetical protein AB1489_43175, partial [Acidobacteriota bacterium]